MFLSFLITENNWEPFYIFIHLLYFLYDEKVEYWIGKSDLHANNLRSETLPGCSLLCPGSSRRVWPSP